MTQLAELVPTLVNGKEIIAIVTDNELGIKKVSIPFSSNVYLSNNRNKWKMQVTNFNYHTSHLAHVYTQYYHAQAAHDSMNFEQAY